MRGREGPDSSPGSYSAAVAPAPRPGRTPDPGLGTPRHPSVVCGLGLGQRPGDRGVPPPPSGGRVPQVPGHGRRGSSCASGRASDPGPLWYPQDALDSTRAGATSSLSSALHSHPCLLAQPGGTLVRDLDRAPTPPGSASPHPRTGDGPQALLGGAQSRAEAFRLDPDR